MMNIRNELRPLEKMNPMGKTKGHEGQNGQNAKGMPAMGGMRAQSMDTYAMSAQAKEATAPAEETSSSQITPSVTVKPSESGSVAGSFSDPADYLAYLTDTYPSITNSNITMSEKALLQAMTDPEKEKVLTDFLTEMDGAADFRASQVAGLNDGEYEYKMDSYTVHIDFIAEDNSGVVGSDFTVLTASRVDGQRMGKEEFGDLKQGVVDYFKEIDQDHYKQQEEMWTAFIQKQLEIKEKQVEKQNAERAEDKIAARREAGEPVAKESAAPPLAQYAPARAAAMANEAEPTSDLPQKGNNISADV